MDGAPVSKETSTSAGLQNEAASSAVSVETQPARIAVLSFAVRLPDNIMQDWDEPAPKANTSLMMMGSTGIVGTITLLDNAVIIWFGWGLIENKNIGGDETKSNTTNVVGSGSSQSMGQFIVAMPKSKYNGGAFSENEPPTSKLIGGEGDEMIGRQMASRLSQRFDIPVFVSCSLTGAAAMDVMQSKGMDHENINTRAAVLAELEIRKLLDNERNNETTKK